MVSVWWNFIGRTNDEITQARSDWMEGTRFGDVTGCDGLRYPPPHCLP